MQQQEKRPSCAAHEHGEAALRVVCLAVLASHTATVMQEVTRVPLLLRHSVNGRPRHYSGSYSLATSPTWPEAAES